MPAFLDPFSGLAPGRMMTPRELSRAIRLALAAEEEAIHLYEAQADATDHPVAKAVLQDIANEERVHAGEFLRLLSILSATEDQFLAEGAGEVDVMASGAAPPAGEPAAEAEPVPVAEPAAAVSVPAETLTIGALR